MNTSLRAVLQEATKDKAQDIGRAHKAAEDAQIAKQEREAKEQRELQLRTARERMWRGARAVIVT